MRPAPAGQAASPPPQQHTVESSLRVIIPKLPRPVSLRARNALDHLDKALKLLPHDRHMASFRAITGEEEAAAALFKALQRQGYPKSHLLDVHDHTHKAGAIACLDAIQMNISQFIKNIKIVVDMAEASIEVMIALSEFNVKQPEGEDYAICPTPPLHILRAKPNGASNNVFDDDFASLATGAKFESIKDLVRAQATARNRLLYASNTSLPRTRVTEEIILRRKNRAVALIGISTIALQSPIHQHMLVQGIDALLQITKRLPKDPEKAPTFS